ncbi:MAG: DUF5995 family protein [Cyclobacteriaceae bacterium]|nr:DUF5995 family protein [Cyclobacteriaceae bacterium]
MENIIVATELRQINSIDQVIATLDQIIAESKKQESPLGYFAALYRKVTIRVKEGILNGEFEDGPRMENLDIIFAKRYIEAYQAYQKKETVTTSWKVAFDLASDNRPIVLQHLLIGMNAHISLDLGIAAAEASQYTIIDDLKNDFDKINDILSSLVSEVEQDLAAIWPFFKYLLKIAGKGDDFLVDFSMKLARDGAWHFATTLDQNPKEFFNDLIEQRDQKVARKSTLITHPGRVVKAIFRMIRLGERGTVAKRIEELEY